MKLIKNIALLSLTSASVLAFAAEEKKSDWTGLFELATTYVTEREKDGVTVDAEVKGYLYSNVNYQVRPNNKLAFELFTPVTYTGTPADFNISHAWIRLGLVQDGAFKVSDWKTKLLWRWQPPTDSATQTAGGWGIFTFRPQISKDWGKYSLMTRNGIGIHLNDQTYQAYTAGGAAPGPSPVFIDTFTIVPAYKVTPEFEISWENNFKFILNGNPPGPVDSAWANTYAYELYFTYDTSKFLPLASVTFSTAHESPYSDFKFFSKNQEYNFKIAYSF